MFPAQRLSRIRRNQSIRNLFCETKVNLDDLIYPIFVDESISGQIPLSLMPGISRFSEKNFVEEMQSAASLGINSFILFGVSSHKDETGSDAFASDGLVHRMISHAKQNLPEANIIADLCFCEYTNHGHCGVVRSDGSIDNDATLVNLGKQAVIAAQAGVDIIAPSGMMDGMVQAIRSALDRATYNHVPIISYSTKFSSGLYGPFREASGVTLKGNRKAYQADPANGRQALLESALDEAEGADALMVKPGLAYLDILAHLRTRTLLPIGMYQVGGEYAMIKFAAQHGAIDEKIIVKESLTAMKRAGADFIFTYFAKQAAQYIKDGW